MKHVQTSHSAGPTMVAVKQINRVAAAASRFVTPDYAGGILWIGVALLAGAILGWGTSSSQAAEPTGAPAPMGTTVVEPSSAAAGALIVKSHELVGQARSFELVQTKSDTITPCTGGQPEGPSKSQLQTSTLRIVNGNPLIVEMTTVDPTGQAIHVFRRGERVALRLGNGPWELPSGPYAQLKDQLAAPYACPLPGTGPNSPQWQIVGAGREQDQDCDVVETIGDSAVAHASGVIAKAMANLANDAAQRPTVRVISYRVRHWVARLDGRRLRVEQSSRMQLTMPRPGGEPMQVEIESTTTSRYQHYDEVVVEIPAEAEHLLGEPVEKTARVPFPVAGLLVLNSR